MRPRAGMLLQWSHELERDWEFNISSPPNETSKGPDLVLGKRLGRAELCCEPTLQTIMTTNADMSYLKQYLEECGLY